jgi:signal transduction histidine kinase
MISISLIFLIIILALHILIALVVFSNNPKNKINKYFVWMVLFGIIWILSNYLENEPFSENYRELFLKLDFYSAVFLGLLFYLFCLNFPRPKTISLKNEIFIYAPAIFFSILAFTNLIIKNIYFEDHTIYFQRGMLYWLYFLCVTTYMGNGLGSLILKYKKSIGIERNQIFYVFLGLFIAVLIALPLNLILPQVIFIPTEFARIGVYAFLSFCIFTAFAITRYHLFEIRVILTEILVVATGLTLLVQAIIAEAILLKVLGGFLVVLFGIFGYQLVKSVIKEIELRAERDKAYDELERIDKAKTEFLSIASHQLRTPLTAVKGYISLILEKSYGEFPEKMKKPLENVFASNERLVKLVNELLNITRLEMGRIELNLEKTHLEEMISSIVEELKITAENKGLYLKWEKPEIPLPETSIDKDKIRQVVLNLVDNAIKYTKEGGITIQLKIEDSKSKIVISDTGVGMEKEEIDKLFDIMVRGKAGAQYWTEGAGLGLYIARKFVEMHGGKVWAESEGRGKGSAFLIELPIK